MNKGIDFSTYATGTLLEQAIDDTSLVHATNGRRAGRAEVALERRIAQIGRARLVDHIAKRGGRRAEHLIGERVRVGNDRGVRRLVDTSAPLVLE